MAARKAFLIDGTAFCYRAFYAIPHLATADGRLTNAVYGFATMLQALCKKEHPDYLAVAFDVGKPTFRHQKFEEYKIHRKPMPEELIAQLPLIKELLEAYRIPVFEREGFEAEDVLATLAKRLTLEGLEVFLVSGDKDVLQLVNSHIKVYNPHREPPIMDATVVRQRFGVDPERMVDLLALMGDATDNIPNVPGIGEKTAQELLQRFGSLQGLFDQLDELGNTKCRKALEATKQQVLLSQELARIDASVPVEIQPEELKAQEPDARRLRNLFRDLQFKRLLLELENGSELELHPAIAHSDDLASWNHYPHTQQPCAVLAQGEFLALAASDKAVWVFLLQKSLFETDQGRLLRQWLEDPKVPKISHDAKTTMHALSRAGTTLQGLMGDTMLAGYLLNPAHTQPTLTDLVDEHLQYSLRPWDAKNSSTDLYAEYAGLVLTLHPHLLAKLEEKELLSLYEQLELPLVHVLYEMEQTGIAIDLDYLATLQAKMQSELTCLCEELYQICGSTFNLNSPKQLAHVLFECLKLPVIKRTKTGPSTDFEVLQQLSRQHPFVQKLIQYRELSKLLSTYVEALPALADKSRSRIHSTFNQTQTATGRLSSSEPNLQNIPVKTELGRLIRKAFVSGAAESVLVAADYSQIELRILAHVSSDEQLLQAFRNEHDIHRFTASLIYGLPENEVQPEQRNAMKSINFGILYGMSAHGLSKELGISFEEAQAFIDAYFQRYPSVRQYLNSQIAKAKELGFVQTLLGRRRYIPELQSKDAATRQFGERMAVNAPIQGTAADLIKQAMVQLHAEIPKNKLSGRLVLQVHDELMWETPRKELRELSVVIRKIMETQGAFGRHPEDHGKCDVPEGPITRHG
ncbi:MAG: DNA polymerase I [Candidatus Omnitrophica bacterium]|nr:DNA polymerase I [Candidatus Omnitrophota bacterium]